MAEQPKYATEEDYWDKETQDLNEFCKLCEENHAVFDVGEGESPKLNPDGSLAQDNE